VPLSTVAKQRILVRGGCPSSSLLSCYGKNLAWLKKKVAQTLSIHEVKLDRYFIRIKRNSLRTIVHYSQYTYLIRGLHVHKPCFSGVLRIQKRQNKCSSLPTDVENSRRSPPPTTIPSTDREVTSHYRQGPTNLQQASRCLRRFALSAVSQTK